MGMNDIEEAISYIESTKKHLLHLGETWYADYLDDAIELLKEQGWNLLTEDNDGVIHGLPGDDGQYLMTDGRDIWIDDYTDRVDDGISLDSGKDIREIKAWMYMPKLPQEGR